MAPVEISPNATQIRKELKGSQALTASESADKLSPEQVAWLRFVDRVERGEQVDPSGQYVAKGAKVNADANGQRNRRPKFDAATAEFARHYGVSSNAATGSGGGVITNIIQPCNPCDSGGGPAPITSTFTSSVGQGGGGKVHDLKIIYGATSDIGQGLVDAGYVKLNSDLNKGAGGAYIYFAFTRDPTKVITAPDAGKSFAGPDNILRGFESNTRGGQFGPVYPSPYFLYMWASQSTYGWSTADLNGGAGGQYIFSYQSKDPRLLYSAEITEVGVLSGNSNTVQPPAGWVKYGNDLNEGAGGDFIYFCYRY